MIDEHLALRKAQSFRVVAKMSNGCAYLAERGNKNEFSENKKELFREFMSFLDPNIWVVMGAKTPSVLLAIRNQN